MLDRYVAAVVSALERGRECYSPIAADTLYFGGGTPTLLGGRRIARIIEAARRLYGLDGAEITIEANPGDDSAELLRKFAATGGNRLSVGMQSHDDIMLRRLGRRHSHADSLELCRDARAAGIENISVDIMLGLEGQGLADVANSIAAAEQAGAAHLSAYLLKVEEGTPFFDRYTGTELLPDDDVQSELYLGACNAAEQLGFSQYEISNFAIPGMEGRHNIKYWYAVPTIGVGASSHSFVDGRRMYYPRDLDGFMEGMEPVDEEYVFPAVGSPEEYIMLRLRLCNGVDEAEFAARFGKVIPDEYRRRAAALPPALVQCDSRGIRLTREGFLLSNPLTARIILKNTEI